MTETHLAVFKGKQIRRTLHSNEWWFSVGDVVEVLTDTVNSSDYIKKMRSRDAELAKGWGQIVTPLWLDTEGGKQQVNCANTEGIFRIIQSIPSPKAEPFKRWLAKVGYERVEEAEESEGISINPFFLNNKDSASLNLLLYKEGAGVVICNPGGSI